VTVGRSWARALAVGASLSAAACSGSSGHVAFVATTSTTDTTVAQPGMTDPAVPGTTLAPSPAVTAPAPPTSRAAQPTTPRRTTTTTATATTGRPPVSASGPSFGSCPALPADDAWNRDVSSLPVHPRSAAWLASIGPGTDVHPDFGSDPTYGIPVTISSGAPPATVTYTAYGDESDPGPFPIPANARVESGGDGHVLVVDQPSCVLYELYAARKVTGGWEADSGARWDLRSNGLRPEGWTSADAAGLPIAPGLARFDELATGRLLHALRFTVRRTSSHHIHPATHDAGSTDSLDVPPMGARFRLKAGFDTSRFTGKSRVIVEGLKRYGMLLADNGSDWFISGDNDPRWDDDDIGQLKSIPGSAFEAVDTGEPIR
jgi:hypothetical protein